MKQILSLIIILLSLNTSAQWSCPSKINAHLKPLWEEAPLSWASELEAGGGILDERLLNNEMGLAALELYFDNFLVYAEGGFKYWSIWENDMQLDKFRTGMREMYINSFGKDYSFKLGLQSIQFQDMFVFNERAIAAYYNWKSTGVNFEAALGTVADNFARNGTFCSKCFQYDLVPDRQRPILADNAFEENFMALVLTIDPDKLNTADASIAATTDTDEFAAFDQADEFEATDEFQSADEFGSSDEFSAMEANTKAPLAKIDNYGLLIYSEFGSYRENPNVFTGFFTNYTLIGDFKLRSEYLMQFNQNPGIIGVFSAEKNISTKYGYSDFYLAYYDFWSFNGSNTGPTLSYTNLFLGEVLRLDFIEFPLLSAFVKHRFKGKGMSLKAQYATNFGSKRLSEFDLQLNKNFGKHIHLIATAGYLVGVQIPQHAYLARAEVRFTF